jgi:hypothetical protein
MARNAIVAIDLRQGRDRRDYGRGFAIRELVCASRRRDLSGRYAKSLERGCMSCWRLRPMGRYVNPLDARNPLSVLLSPTRVPPTDAA